jgi:hypothetical protein
LNDTPKTEKLSYRWTKLEKNKTTRTGRCEEYASWTLPYMFPRSGSENVELQNAPDPIGAKGVNHLANKAATVLFPHRELFFRLTIAAFIRKELEGVMSQAASAQGADVEASKSQVADQINKLEEELAASEREALEYLDMVTYRPEVINALKLLIITGNALVFHPKGRKPQVYTLRDYSVVRDLGGEVIEIMTREMKALETFAPAVQEKIKADRKKRKGEKAADEDNVTIYTQIRLDDDGRFKVRQAADDTPLLEVDDNSTAFPKDKLPWIVVTWNLIRGEDYGRGLVEEYAGAFHGINVLTRALVNIGAIMGDLKFLVDDSSNIDVDELNNSEPGTYHSGKPESVKAIQLDKVSDAQFLLTMIERYEKQIAQAFLLNSELTRDAERVTAEEFRGQAMELETSNGGIYSRLASTWQLQTAHVILDQIDFVGVGDGVVPKVVTGMDSLSRAGELDNIRMFLGDLAIMNNLPDDTRARLKQSNLISMIGTNRQVDWKQIVKSEAEYAAEQQQLMQQQQELMAQQQAGNVAEAGAKEAMKGDNVRS